MTLSRPKKLLLVLSTATGTCDMIKGDAQGEGPGGKNNKFSKIDFQKWKSWRTLWESIQAGQN